MECYRLLVTWSVDYCRTYKQYILHQSFISKLEFVRKLSTVPTGMLVGDQFNAGLTPGSAPSCAKQH